MNLVQIALIYGEQLQWQNIEDSFNLNVISNDQAPTDLSLSNNEISENLGTNTLIGTLSTTAPNITNTFNYSLVSGTGSNDNSLFTIIDNQLISNAIFNYEIRNNYSIRIRTTDQNGLFYEEVLEVNILNINEAPTNLNLTLNKNSYHPSETLDIVGNVRDGDGGEDLAKIDLWLQRPNLTWVNLSPIENFENDGDFEQQFSLENYQIGTYQMYARAQDKQGMFSEWVTNTFSVENQTTTLESIPSLTALSLTANLETDEVDILTGTSNIDLFELGDTEEVYYSISGIEDYALINNFDVNKDKIQLHGNLEDYYLGTASENLPQGTTIFSNNNELIGIVTGVYELSLHEDYFTFV
ncbi:MAG: cadherin repeat domain-containing protein [Crocosphaera sp.]|nr:cadherin repeat domain-containing protein [Crocosphaera sp.]